MSFLDHIRACNQYDLTAFLPFRVNGMTVGWLRKGFAQRLCAWPRVFAVAEMAVDLSPELETFQARSEAVASVVEELVEQGVIAQLHGERYVATPRTRAQGLLLIDRAAAPYFGVRAFGQHLNGFVRERGQVKLWVARRALDRRNYPGQLDNLVAGGLPYGLSLQANLIKECREEAGMPVELVSQARLVSMLSYNAEMPAGLKPDTLYCYDLELPADFRPCCEDGEVEDFYLWPVEQVLETVRDTNAFKFNCNLVIIDFLLRHGYIGPENEGYLELICGLYPPSGAPVALTGGAPPALSNVLDLFCNAALPLEPVENRWVKSR